MENPFFKISVLEQDALLSLLFFNKGFRWVPARLEVDIVYEKARMWPPQGAEKD